MSPAAYEIRDFLAHSVIRSDWIELDSDDEVRPRTDLFGFAGLKRDQNGCCTDPFTAVQPRVPPTRHRARRRLGEERGRRRDPGAFQQALLELRFRVVYPAPVGLARVLTKP